MFFDLRCKPIHQLSLRLAEDPVLSVTAKNFSQSQHEITFDGVASVSKCPRGGRIRTPRLFAPFQKEIAGALTNPGNRAFVASRMAPAPVFQGYWWLAPFRSQS